MKQFDTIIIGSWLWWLSAWALLAKKWQKVLVLEKHIIPWWYATNFKRKDYEFDVALHQIGSNSSWFKKILREAGIYEKLKFIKHKYLYEAIYPDYTLHVENGNGDKFKKDLIKLFPKEWFWIRLWFFLIKYVWFQLKIWDFANTHKIFSPFIMLFTPILIPILAFWDKIKISQLLDICTRNNKLQKIFMELLWYFGNNLDLSAIYFLIPAHWFYYNWWYYVEWWWQAVSDAFVDVIKENYWEAITNLEWEEIILEDNKAIGVKTRKWNFYAKNIVCNASPFILYEKLLKKWEWSKKELGKIHKIKIWPSIWSAYIWINTTIEKLNSEFKESYIVSMNDTYDIEFKKNNALWFTITNHKDNPNIPLWKTVITVALFEEYKDWAKLDEKTYKNKKETYKEELLKRLENLFPEIRNHIEVFELWTPKTMERYTWNKNGAIYWFSKDVSKNWTYWNKTPIENIFLSSARSFWGWFEWVIRAWNEVIKKIL